MPDLDAWLAAQEGGIPDLRAGDAKEIVWAAERGAVTDIALIYLHGFSATKWEIDPVHRHVAAKLGANLFLARLAGHGRSAAAMGTVKLADWQADLAEAMAIARQIGRRVVIIGTSTGGTLATLAAARQDVAGVVLVSPNYALNRYVNWLFALPGIRAWGPRIAGKERGFTALSVAHAAHWTTRYPTSALWPMIELMRVADPAAARAPALFLWSKADRVIDPRAVEQAAMKWGGAVTRQPVTLGQRDDPFRHILCGDILSPDQTERVTGLIAAWIGQL
ncbi:carboxylesterase [Falsirhodobacter sp. alg1]|uniref:alpha/beta hydrolase n=1 Tax=Falsirhodobacter sp. alg1 TaxID=1472418 RepID=UPI001EDB77BA|nr:alpha/beta fold hydrolase [Falsirhodobacter sp. alg1]